MNKILELIRPIVTHDLIRVGRNKDGGYVINRIAMEMSNLLSFGINDDWSFEEDFAQRSGCRVEMYDGSVSLRKFKTDKSNLFMEFFSLRFLYALIKIPGAAKRQFTNYNNAKKVYSEFEKLLKSGSFIFHSNFVSNFTYGNAIAIQEILEKLDNQRGWFLKIDIESHEYRILQQVAKFAPKISGLAIEFHDLDMIPEKFEQIINELKESFFITHVHANNYNPVHPAIGMPACWEISFINKNLVSSGSKVVKGIDYPLKGLDYPNLDTVPDFQFSY